MAENHLEFLRAVPGPAPSLGPVPPLDPVPPHLDPAKRRPGAPDPIAQLRADLQNRLASIGHQRALVVELLRADHRQFRELEASAAALIDAIAELERHRLARGEESANA